MKKHNTKITYKSIEQSLVKDYKRSLAEFIWNGYDAGASKISIEYEANEIGFITQLKIIDNGSGISIDNIDLTFGQFLDSQKEISNNYSGIIKGKKGKGRFAFMTFCNRAKWITTCKNNYDYLSYDILLNKETLPEFTTDNNILNKYSQTGTVVEFSNFTELTSDLLESNDLYDFLTDEFGWFLFLNKKDNFSLKINDKNIDYNDIIEYSLPTNINIEDFEFDINFIKWKRNIGDKYYFYFLNNDCKIVDRQHTSFNNKTEDFHHSVYINSSFFDNFFVTKEENGQAFPEFGNTRESSAYKKLLRELNQIVTEQEKEFIREKKADNLIEKYKKENIFPSFKNNPYDKLRQEHLESVVKEIYCLNPKIFQGLRNPQSKTLVGFLNLLLDSEQRDNIIKILEGIIDLTDEERSSFAKILNDTKLSHITKLVGLLNERYKVISILKLLVFDLEKFTNERDHLQKIIENNYWLFGEQYHLVSADVNLEKVLNNYLAFIESDNKDKQKLSQPDKLKRPDIFISRQIQSSEIINDEYSIEENIIVELKRPSVVIGKKQFDQIEEYIRFIIKEPRFNSELRRWKLILVAKDIDEYIQDKYESNKSKGKKFLIESVKNYEIYALKWDDLFKTFDLRHNHLIKNLEFKDILLEDFNDRDKKLIPATLTEELINNIPPF